jgi:anti-sigma factor RsiW
MSGAGDFERDVVGRDGGDADSFDALAALLPFYVNGQLSPEERARVEAGLAGMPELRAELAEVQALSALVKRSGAEWTGSAAAEGLPEVRSDAQSEAASEPALASPPARLQRLMARIEEEASARATSAEASPQGASAQTQQADSMQQALPSEPPPQVLPFPQTPKHIPATSDRAPQRQPFRQRLFQPPYSMALAAGLAAVALVQAGLLMRAQPPEDETYASLSGTGQPAPAAIIFSLRLKPETPWGEVIDLLNRRDLRIVAGPRDGMIDVAPNAALSVAQTEALEEALQASPLVVFVGRGS